MSMHVLSGSVARLMNSVVDDDDIQVGSLKNKKMLKPLIIFIEKWNHMVDIMLGHAHGAYTRANGRKCQLELLSFLRWLTKWHNDHLERIEEKATYCYAVKDIQWSESNFFADET